MGISMCFYGNTILLTFEYVLEYIFIHFFLGNHSKYVWNTLHVCCRLSNVIIFVFVFIYSYIYIVKQY